MIPSPLNGPDGAIARNAVPPAGSLSQSRDETPRSQRRRLKEATDAAHRRLDAALSRFDLADAGDYGRFLAVHALALPCLEEALAQGGFDLACPGWSGGRRGAALLADLAGLGREPGACPTAPAVRGAEAWGVAYVLEGSRLGGKVLARRVTRGGGPAARANARFLNAPAALPWSRFVERMERALPSPADGDAAIRGALMAFATFEEAVARFAGPRAPSVGDVGMGERT